MKEVLISIQPKWVEKIVSGKKTVEVRKTKPKLETPFKVYIYETLGKTKWCNTCKDVCERPYLNCACHEGWGKVVGEFVCDGIDEFVNLPLSLFAPICALEQTCLTAEQIREYLNGKNGYGWHITELVVYDEPRELSEFYHYCGDDPNCSGCEAHYFSNTECGKEDYCCSPIEGCKPIKRAPQSWQFCVATEPRQTAD